MAVKTFDENALYCFKIELGGLLDLFAAGYWLCDS